MPSDGCPACKCKNLGDFLIAAASSHAGQPHAGGRAVILAALALEMDLHPVCVEWRTIYDRLATQDCWRQGISVCHADLLGIHLGGFHARRSVRGAPLERAVRRPALVARGKDTR